MISIFSFRTADSHQQRETAPSYCTSSWRRRRTRRSSSSSSSNNCMIDIWCIQHGTMYCHFTPSTMVQKWVKSSICNLFVNLLTNSTEQGPSWKTNSHSAIKEIIHHLQNPKVHYCVCKSPPLFSVYIRWLQSTPSHPISLRSILILPYHLCLDLPSGSSLQAFWAKFCMHFSSLPMCATSPSNIILLDLIITEVYKLWSSLLEVSSPAVLYQFQNHCRNIQRKALPAAQSGFWPKKKVQFWNSLYPPQITRNLLWRWLWWWRWWRFRLTYSRCVNVSPKNMMYYLIHFHGCKI